MSSKQYIAACRTLNVYDNVDNALFTFSTENDKWDQEDGDELIRFDHNEQEVITIHSFKNKLYIFNSSNIILLNFSKMFESITWFKSPYN